MSIWKKKKRKQSSDEVLSVKYYNVVVEGTEGRQMQLTLSLPQVSCLDEDRLEDERSYWEQRIDREYNRKYPRYATIRRIRSTIRGIEFKLRAIDTFVSATNGVYRNAMALLEVLSRKDTGIDSVSYNAKENMLQFEEVNEEWLLELEKGSAKRLFITVR